MTTQEIARDNGINFNLLRYISLMLVVVGSGVSAYLSYFYWNDEIIPCVEGGMFQCDVVQKSIYSEMFGIPIAFFGLATYLLIGMLLLLEDRVNYLQENGLVIVFGVVFFAFLYSLYLVYIQGVVLKAWCQWCLLHELTITTLLFVTGLRLRQRWMR